MAGIDDRIVSMVFENAKFEAGVAKTMASLAKLEETLKKLGSTTGLGDLQKKLSLPGVSKGFNDIQAAASKVSLSSLASAADNIKTKFTSVTSAVSGALSTLTEKLKFRGAATGLDDIEKNSSKVRFAGLSGAIDSIREKLRFTGTASSFAEIENASQKVHLSGITNATAAAGRSFSVMQGAAAVALGNIVSRAAMAGTNILKSFTIQPLIDGFKGYETQINAVQTILANTGLVGKKGIDQVNASLADLQEYANKTVYNFSEMARNIGTFTAAGVDLKTATASIKGIANLAALSGSNSQQASTAMYQLSQAIASGKVGLQDWNSVVNAGLGGGIFQKALANTALASGVLDKNAVKLTGSMKTLSINGESFRNSISAKPGQQSWLTSGVLTKTLEQLSGNLSLAQLKAEGFTDAQAKNVLKLGKTASSAATNIKTFSQLTEALKEEVATAYGTIFKTIFGDLGKATTLFSGIHTVVENGLTLPLYALNKLLVATAKLGGRAKFLDGLKNAFNGIKAVIQPVKEAFRDIFPKQTPTGLLHIITSFDNFTKKLKIGADTAENIRRTFRGVFSVLDIGKQIVKGVFTAFGTLFSSAGKGSGGFLSFTASVGDMLIKLDEFLKKGDKVKLFFQGVGNVISAPVHLLGVFATAIKNLFGGKSVTDNLSGEFSTVGDKLKPLPKAVEAVKKAFKALGDVGSTLGSKLGDVGKELGGVLSKFTGKLADAIKTGDYSAVFGAIQTTLVGGIFLTLRKALGGGSGGPKIDLGGGFGKQLSTTFNELNKSLVAFQQNIKANALLKIAGAISLLTGSLLILSKLKPEAITTSLIAMAAGLKILLNSLISLKSVGFKTSGAATGLLIIAAALNGLAVAMRIIAKLNFSEVARGIFGIFGALKAISIGTAKMGPSLIKVGIALNPIAVALNILGFALKRIGDLDFSTIAKGVVGIFGALKAISQGTLRMQASLLKVGTALLPIATALNILAVAMKQFAKMKLEDIAKGVASIFFALKSIDRGAALLGPELLTIGPGLIVVGAGLLVIARAVRAFGSMDLKSMGTGLLGIAASLVVIGTAIKVMPVGLGERALSLVVLAVALNGIARAVKIFGSMSLGQVVQGIAAMGGAIRILAEGLYFMDGTLPGAAALLVAAGALSLLAPLLVFLGNVSMLTIARGLGAISATIITIGVAGVIAAPGLLLLGLALRGLAIGLVGISVGVYILAKGLALLGGKGTKGVAVLIAAITALIAVLPNLVISFIQGVVKIIEEIVNLAPTVVVALAKILETAIGLIVKEVINIIDAIIKIIITEAPKLAVAAIAIIDAILTVLKARVPEIINTLFNLINTFLVALRQNLPGIVLLVGDIIANFLNALAIETPKIITAGVNFIVAFLNGISRNVPRLVTAVSTFLTTMLNVITTKLPSLVTSGAKLLAAFVQGIANNIGRVISAGANLIVKILEGIGSKADAVASAAARMIGNFLSAAATAMLNLVNRIAQVILNFLVGIRKAIDKYEPQFIHEGFRIGVAIVRGMIKGIASLAGDAINSVKDVAKNMINAGLHKFGIKSPSRVFNDIGSRLIEGLVLGVNTDGSQAVGSIENVGDQMVKKMHSTFSSIPGILDGVMDTNPVIAPVLDLTAVHKEAKNLPDLTTKLGVDASTSFNQATAISSEKAAADAIQVELASVADKPSVKFEQNNYSPEALSKAEIYRRTNNQVSQMKTLVGAG